MKFRFKSFACYQMLNDGYIEIQIDKNINGGDLHKINEFTNIYNAEKLKGITFPNFKVISSIIQYFCMKIFNCYK